MIKIKNIYWMLAYAFNTLHDTGTQSIKTEEFDNIYNLFAKIMIKSINYQIKKGLNKAYELKSESLSNIRGKIVISDSIKMNTLKEHKLICEFDEFSENCFMNQIIKSTLCELFNVKELDNSYRQEIKKILYYFKNVNQITINNINWGMLKYNKNNVTYRMIINVCYLIIKGLLLTTEEGEKKYNTFIDESRMSSLYERFVKEYYRRHFPTLNARALHIDWNIDKAEEIGLLPDMKTDITLSYKEKILIIDTKYYAKSLQNNSMFDKKTIINSNIYQIFTYVKNKDLNDTGNVSGMLLYAKTDEEEFPNQTNIFGKNKISCRTLDLSKEFEEVMLQLDDIAYGLTNNELKRLF